MNGLSGQDGRLLTISTSDLQIKIHQLKSVGKINNIQ
jgi:hypothetical protein